MYRQHLDECDGTTTLGRECRGCLPRRAEYGLLCHTCHRRLELVLTDAPVIDRWLTGNLAPHDSGINENGKVQGGGDGSPAPLSVEILTQRNLMRDQLTEWVDDWCEQRTLVGPDHHTVASDAQFLLMWLPTMEREDWIGDWWEALAETISQAHALAPWRPAVRRIPRVPCPGCGESNLVIYGGGSDVTCQSCKIIMTEERFGLWERVLEQEAEAS